MNFLFILFDITPSIVVVLCSSSRPSTAISKLGTSFKATPIKLPEENDIDNMSYPVSIPTKSSDDTLNYQKYYQKILKSEAYRDSLQDSITHEINDSNKNLIGKYGEQNIDNYPNGNSVSTSYNDDSYNEYMEVINKKIPNAQYIHDVDYKQFGL